MLRLRTIVALVLVGLAGAAVASVAAGGPLTVLGVVTDTTVDTSTDTTPPTSDTTTATTTEPPPETTETAPTTDTAPATTDPPPTTETAPETTTTTATTTTTTTTAPPATDTSTTPDGPPPEDGFTDDITIQPAQVPGGAGGGRRPPDVTDVSARHGNDWVYIRWTKPDDPQFARVVIVRTPGKNGVAQSRVYSGSGTSFRDHGLVQGAEYRYLLTAVTRNGASSAGIEVIVAGKPRLLLRPADGARVRRAPPKLTWLKVTGARYYNVQLFLRGRKVLSAWPGKNSYRLPRTWTYRGRTHRLVAGKYTWYVWPGFGKQAKGRYGALLGESVFRYFPY